jgi:hypothetical protein
MDLDRRQFILGAGAAGIMAILPLSAVSAATAHNASGYQVVKTFVLGYSQSKDGGPWHFNEHQFIIGDVIWIPDDGFSVISMLTDNLIHEDIIEAPIRGHLGELPTPSKVDDVFVMSDAPVPNDGKWHRATWRWY